MLLLRHGFVFLSAASASIFFLLLLLQWRYLPNLAGTDHASKRTVWDDWRSVLKQWDFIVFCFLMSAYYVMFNQIYIVLPLSVPDNEAVTAIFTLTAILGIILQIPVNQVTTNFFPRPFRLGLGMAVMALSFPILSTDWGTLREIPVAPLVTTAVLSIGMLILFPTALSMIPELGQERHQGVCFGVFYLFAGIAGASGGGLSAWLWDLNQKLLLFGLAGIGVLFALLLWIHTARIDYRVSRS
jgi:hypothetical protein